MWRTSDGIRTLGGAEAKLIRAVVSDMVHSLREEAVDPEEAWPCGVELFDELAWQQRLALLDCVAHALLDPAMEPPKLTAVNEAAVAAVFAVMYQNLGYELDTEDLVDLSPDADCQYWRRLVAACQTDPDDECYVEVDSTDDDEWRLLIQSLTDQILWDDDWNMPELFMDVTPECGGDRKEALGIEDDYYVCPAPDLREEEVAVVFERLRRLIGESA